MATGQDELFVTIGGKDVGLQAVLKKVDTEMQKSADSAVRLGQSYARLAQAQQRPAAAAQILAGTIAQAGGASEKALLGIQTQASRTNSGLQVLPRTLAGLSHEAASFATGMLGVGTALTVATNVAQSFAEAFTFKAQLDATTLSVNAQIKGIRESSEVWAEASAFAQEYKLTTQETTEAIQASVGVMRTSKAPIEDILSVLARLQVLSPEQSLQEAAVAVKALASGDTTSLVTRFEVGRDVANEMKAAIQGGADAVQVLNGFLNDTGIGTDVLKTKTEGAAGAIKDLAIAQEELKLAQAAFAQGPGLAILEGQIRATSGATRLLSGDFAAMGTSLQATLAAWDAQAVAASNGATAAEQAAAGLAAYNAVAGLTAGVVAQNTNATKDDIDATTLAADAKVLLAAQTQASADASLVDAAQKEAEKVATDNLQAATNNAVTAFLALNPTIDAAGIAALVAAGKIPALVGQLASLRVAAYSARDAIAALAAQQAINTKSLIGPGGPGVNAPGRTSGRNNDVDAVYALQKANKDAADAQSAQNIALGTDKQKLIELEKLYADTVKASGKDSADAIKAQTRLELERQSQLKSKGGGKGGGGGGTPGISKVKLTDQQKLNNSLLADQEQYQDKSADAEAAYLDDVLKINQDFQEKMLDAQRDFDQDRMDSRASFYDQQGSIESEGIRQAASQAYEAASIEAEKIAQEKGADVANKYMDAQEQIISDRAKRQDDIEKALNKKDKEEFDPDKAKYLQGVDALYRKAEDAKLARIKEGEGSLATERDKQLDDAAAKEAEAFEKIGTASDRATERKILGSQRAGKIVDEEKLKVDGLTTSYNNLGAAGARAGITPAAGTPPSTSTTGAAPDATVAGAPTDDPIVSAVREAAATIVGALAGVKNGVDSTTSAVRGLSGKFAG